MSAYDDLVRLKGTGSPLDRLVPLESAKIADVKAAFGAVPDDYVSFLQEVGFGELGEQAFMLYGGLVSPEEIYGEPNEQLNGVLLFGDDFQGYNTGFETSTGKVVEIDPINHQVRPVSSTFEGFMRRKIGELS
jgi:hypothetical protein